MEQCIIVVVICMPHKNEPSGWRQMSVKASHSIGLLTVCSKVHTG